MYLGGNHRWVPLFYIPVSGQLQLQTPFLHPEGVRLAVLQL